MNDDLLEGAEQIGAFIWGGGQKATRRVYACAENGELPVFRIGTILHARKSTLLEFFERREREAVSKKPEAA